MPNWTKDQQKAIETENTNIIVSAGAGSGKTAVLSERVLQKLNKGIKINELLILTFTNAAAGEMKERIRKKITDNPSLSENLDLIDSAYITTFDSFTLSLVKKYHYLLNISKNIAIAPSGIMDVLKKDTLDEIFDELYENDAPLFLKFIDDFCVKNDTELMQSILDIILSLELKSDKKEFLDTYFDKFLSDEKIGKYVFDFVGLIKKEISNIETTLYILEDSDFPDYFVKLQDTLVPLVNSKTYDEILKNVNVSLPRRPKNSEDIKEYKEAIDNSLKLIKSYLRFENEKEIYESFNISKEYIEVIINIIKMFDKKIMDYKFKNDLYEFTDIELMAIKLLKDNEEIREEIKNYYHEIMVDEYQDTNDLQEEFVSLIAKGNVYMVGDIKQSIYGFRNANPLIFKNKYDKYSENNDGIKIDLLNNFRSRKEVLEGINKLFNLIMDDDIGGANYPASHQMIFGNMSYEENKKQDQNYDLEILNYQKIDNKYTHEEIESFIIAKDIIKKLNDKYEVVDKQKGTLRPCNYSDFCIIMDRNTSFSVYKKVFEYLQIPLVIYEDSKLTGEVEVSLLKNIITLILCINKKDFSKKFKYAFYSVMRSFIYEIKDDEIFNIFYKKDYFKTDLFSKCDKIAKMLDYLSMFEVLNLIIDEFNIYENLIKIGSVTDSLLKIDNLVNLGSSLNSVGYTLEDFANYLEKLNEIGFEITYKGENTCGDGVKLMNIHKSKGLEFPVCYFSGFHKPFNTSDIKAKFIYNSEFGFITPYFKEGIGSLILKDLLKSKYNIETISEKLRLLYVALTRAKEKMIIVANLDEEYQYVSNKVEFKVREKYNSFLSIINSVSGNLNDYIKNVDVNNLNISKDYLYQNNESKFLESADNKIVYKILNVDNQILTKKKASKKVKELINEDDIKKMEYGIKVHEIFEYTDFLNVPKNHKYFNVINNFVKTLGINVKTKIYKEHEFVYEKNGEVIHGLIDLVLVDDDIKIIDYKLKNIKDDNYKKQLNIYREYIKLIFNKEPRIYLYSIIDNFLEEL